MLTRRVTLIAAGLPVLVGLISAIAAQAPERNPSYLASGWPASIPPDAMADAPPAVPSCYVLADLMPGANAGEKIAAAYDTLGKYYPIHGGIIDGRRLCGLQEIRQDIFTGQPTIPVVLLFGRATFTVYVPQNIPSYTGFVLDGTRFQLPDQTYSFMFRGRMDTTTAIVSSTSPVIQPANLATFDVDPGDTLLIGGHVSRKGKDDAKLQRNMDSEDTRIHVVSAAGFSTIHRALRVDDELMQWSSIVPDAGHDDFLLEARGVGCTPQVGHLVQAGKREVKRTVYEKFLAVSVDRTAGIVTLDRSPTISGACLGIQVGPSDVFFEGMGVLDGRKSTFPNPANGIGIWAAAPRRWRIGPGIRFVNWDHHAVMLEAAMDCEVDGRYEGCGWRQERMGSGVILFRNCSRNVVRGSYFDCDRGIIVDDRITSPIERDNPSNGNLLAPSSLDQVRLGVHVEGSDSNMVVCPAVGTVDSAAVTLNMAQWISTGAGRDTVRANLVELGRLADPAALALAQWINGGGNTFLLRSPGSVVLEQVAGAAAGNQFVTPDNVITTELSAAPPAPKTVDTDALLGNRFRVVVGTGVTSVTMAKPAKATPGRILVYDLLNNSGGTWAAITWDIDAFKLADVTFSVPAIGKRRTIAFYHDGTYWIEIQRAAADIS